MSISNQPTVTNIVIAPSAPVEASPVPVYQTVEVIVPRSLIKALSRLTDDQLAREVACLLREEGQRLPLIAVVAVDGGTDAGPMRMQSARTDELLLLGEAEYREWKEGRPAAFLNLLRSALSKPADFVRIGFRSLTN